MVLVAAGLTFTSPSAVSKVCGIFGPLLGVSSICVYLIMTMDFPDNKEFTFGAVFYISFLLGLLTMGTSVAAALSTPPKGVAYDDHGGAGMLEFENFDGRSHGKGDGKGAGEGPGHQPPMQQGMHQGYGGGPEMQVSGYGMQNGSQQYPYPPQQQDGFQMQGMQVNGRQLQFDAHGNAITPSAAGAMSNPFGR